MHPGPATPPHRLQSAAAAALAN